MCIPKTIIMVGFILQEEDQEDDYKSADDQVTSPLEHVPAESVDYIEEPVLPVEEPYRGEPAEDQFMSMTRDGGVAPGNEAEQHSVMGAPPSIITQANLMKYVCFSNYIRHCPLCLLTAVS